MKHYLLIFIISIIKIILIHSQNNFLSNEINKEYQTNSQNQDLALFNINQNLNSENNSDDSVDIIFQLKKVMDNYVKKLESSIITVDKIVLSNKSTNLNSNIQYIKNFDFDIFNKEITKYLDNLTKIRNSNLKDYREDKQSTEENNLDLETKNKILQNRINIANEEKMKILNDFNSKNSLKNKVINDINMLKTQTDNFSTNTNTKLNSISKQLDEFDRSKIYNIKK
jgi:hypothetical protein